MDGKQSKFISDGGEIEATLTRLLEAEERAETIVQAASDEREKAIDAAVAQVRAAELELESTLNELRAPFIKEAEARAAQEIGELTLKYEERQRQLRKLGELHLEEALQAAEAVMLDPAR